MEIYIPDSIRQFVPIRHDSLEVHTSITQKQGMEKKKKRKFSKKHDRRALKLHEWKRNTDTEEHS